MQLQMLHSVLVIICLMWNLKVSRLEEELVNKDTYHQEEITKMKEQVEKLKKTIAEYEENIQELRTRGSEQSEVILVPVDQMATAFVCSLGPGG